MRNKFHTNSLCDILFDSNSIKIARTKQTQRRIAATQRVINLFEPIDDTPSEVIEHYETM
jgi:hypothetical protein